MGYYGGDSDDKLMRKYEKNRDYYEKGKIEDELESRGYKHDGSGWVDEDDDYSNSDDNVGLGGLSFIFPLIGIYFILGLVGVVLWEPAIEPYLKHSSQWFPKDVYINRTTWGDKALLHVFSLTIVSVSAAGLWAIGKIIPFVGRIKKVIPISFLIASPAVMIWEGLQFDSFPILASLGFFLTFACSLWLVFNLKTRWLIGSAMILISTTGFILTGNTYIHSFFALYLTAASFLFIIKR